MREHIKSCKIMDLVIYYTLVFLLHYFPIIKFLISIKLIFIHIIKNLPPFCKIFNVQDCNIKKWCSNDVVGSNLGKSQCNRVHYFGGFLLFWLLFTIAIYATAEHCLNIYDSVCSP